MRAMARFETSSVDADASDTLAPLWPPGCSKPATGFAAFGKAALAGVEEQVP
jgi:hypothetical protein